MKYVALISLVFLLISCNSGNKTQQIEYRENKIVQFADPIYSVDELQNNKKLFSIADSILKIETHPNIVNLHSVDTTDVTVLEDYFIYPDKKSKMVFFGCDAGLSSGNLNKLLMVFDRENEKAELIWSGQHALFSKKNINDLNGDGIMEIVNVSSVAWMSSEMELFEIINFKNGKRNKIYSTLSNTQRDYFEEDWYFLGDTIACTYKNMILDSDKDGMFRIKQTKIIKLFNGGKTREEAFKKCKTDVSTEIVEIKEIRE